MKYSTRARYGLRMMVELARALQDKPLVHLGEVATTTGISMNYLAQLAMPLKNNGLLVGVSGKGGGYSLGRPAEEIKISEIIEAVQGPTALTDCTANPDLCMHAPFCDTRLIWVIAGHRLHEVFEQFSLADIIRKGFRQDTLREYGSVPLLNPEEQRCSGAEPQQNAAARKDK